MSEPMRISERMVGPGHPLWIIAEIGINQVGSAETCARMIEAAAAWHSA
jgi:sialic acid synthase SpsE